MGIIISTLASLKNIILKPRRDKKTSDEAQHQQRQTLPPHQQQQQDIGVPSAQPPVKSTRAAAPALTGGVAEAQKAVGVTSPVPLGESGIQKGSSSTA